MLSIGRAFFFHFIGYPACWSFFRLETDRFLQTVEYSGVERWDRFNSLRLSEH